MARNRNTDINGKSFGSTTVGAVWKKGRTIDRYSPDEWRYDIYCNPMKFSDYGNVREWVFSLFSRQQPMPGSALST
jgi:hypothetical protein